MSSVAPCGTSAGKSAGCTADGGGGGLCSARGERKAGRGERLGGSSDGGAGAAGAVGLRVSCAWSDCVHALMTVLVSCGLTAAVHTSQLTSQDNVHLHVYGGDCRQWRVSVGSVFCRAGGIGQLPGTREQRSMQGKAVWKFGSVAGSAMPVGRAAHFMSHARPSALPRARGMNHVTAQLCESTPKV